MNGSLWVCQNCPTAPCLLLHVSRCRRKKKLMGTLCTLSPVRKPMWTSWRRWETHGDDVRLINGQLASAPRKWPLINGENRKPATAARFWHRSSASAGPEFDGSTASKTYPHQEIQWDNDNKIMTEIPRDMGLSENSVPRKTQWLMIIIPTKWL